MVTFPNSADCSPKFAILSSRLVTAAWIAVFALLSLLNFDSFCLNSKSYKKYQTKNTKYFKHWKLPYAYSWLSNTHNLSLLLMWVIREQLASSACVSWHTHMWPNCGTNTPCDLSIFALQSSNYEKAEYFDLYADWLYFILS